MNGPAFCRASAHTVQPHPTAQCPYVPDIRPEQSGTGRTIAQSINMVSDWTNSDIAHIVRYHNILS